MEEEKGPSPILPGRILAASGIGAVTEWLIRLPDQRYMLGMPRRTLDHPLPIAELLRQVHPELRQPQHAETDPLRRSWVRAVGEISANHTTKLELSGNVLQVEVDQERWGRELKLLYDAILARLKTMPATSQVRAIRIRIIPGS